jgi:hypothetical protein
VIGSGCGTTYDTNGATATSWATDGNLNATIFTGGGSKDPINVDQWALKDGAGGLPDKDNLLHSIGARYSLTPTTPGAPAPTAPVARASPPRLHEECEVLFFGSDRYDNRGDAQQGFWFFQNKIGFGTNAVGGGTGFSGVHKNGDILVISDFSVGGSTSTITVYKWDDTCKKTTGTCGDPNLRALGTSTNALCGGGNGTGDLFCGIVNSANGTVAPWGSDFTDKSGLHFYCRVSSTKAASTCRPGLRRRMLLEHRVGDPLIDVDDRDAERLRPRRFRALRFQRGDDTEDRRRWDDRGRRPLHRHRFRHSERLSSAHRQRDHELDRIAGVQPLWSDRERQLRRRRYLDRLVPDDHPGDA